MKKRTKIFLGGFVNYVNAQNLNCRSLALHLNKEKFEVYTLELYSGQLPSLIESNVKIFHCFYPSRISIYLGFLWGIWHCDIAYLPKGEICRWNKFWLKLFGKKSFRTIEGIYGDDLLREIQSRGITYKSFIESFTGYDKLYSITRFVQEFNFKKHGIKTDPKILYLGSDIELFLNENKKIQALKHVVFIGRLKKRKGVYDILKFARIFPDIQFSIIGNGEEEQKLQAYMKKNNIKNIELLGTLDHKTIANYLRSCDLHLFPSRSEGFPKVTLETAAAGVPTLLYNKYGADEWITNDVDGFIVKDFNEMKEKLETLKKDPQRLKKTSKNAIQMAKRFDWKSIIKEWENVIEEVSGRTKAQ